LNKAFSTNYYISTSGNDGNNGTAIGTPKATLASVFSTYNLTTGDVINVAAGTYTEKGITIGADDDGFTILGASMATTIFDSDQTEFWIRAANAANDNITFQELTIKDYKRSSTGDGGAVFLLSGCNTIAFTNVTFDNCDPYNSTYSGGAIYLGGNTGVTITGCTFTGSNGSTFGSCVSDRSATSLSTITISKCTFYNNSASYGSAIYLEFASTTLSATNCLFYDNTTTAGGCLDFTGIGTTTVTNCTIAQNTGDQVKTWTSGTYNMKNVIAYGNNADYDFEDIGGTINLTNCFYGGAGDLSIGGSNTSGVTGNPLFTNAAGGDFSLQSTSTARDAGTSTGAPADDIIGTTRDGSPDIGCYEYADNTWTGTTSTAWTTTTNWSLSSVPTSSSSPIIPNVVNQPEITSVVTLAGLTVDSGADITITSNSLTVTGAIDLNGTMYIDNATVNADGTFDATGGTIDFTGAGNLILSSTVTSLGTLDTALGTVTYDGGAQTVLADSYYNLSISTAGTKTAGGNVDVNGNLTTAATATCKLDMSTYDLNIAGNLTVGATNGLDLSDASALLTLDGTGDQTITHAGTSSGSGTTTLLTETFNNAWSSLEKPTASWTSDVEQNSSQAWHRNNVTTNWSYTSSGSPSSNGYTGGGTDYYARFHSYGITSPNTTYIQTPSIDLSSYSPGSVTFYYINPSGTDVLEVYFYNGTTWVKQGSSYGTQASWSQKTIAISGAYLNSSFAVRFKAISDYGYDDIGIDQVVITGDYSYTSTEATDFTINKSGGDVILSSEFTVDGTLTLTSGVIDASANNLLLTDNATISGSSDASHVKGTIVKTIASDAAHVFPLGDGTALRKVTIDPNDATSRDWTVSLTGSAYGDLTMTGGVTDVSSSFYWDISPTTTPASTNVTLAWESAVGIQDADLTDIRVVHFNGADWEEIAQTGTTGTPSSGSVTGAVTSFSPFTIGTVGATPLPIKLLNFTGYKYNDYDNKLEWTTLTEKNADYLEIEKSNDGLFFEQIGSQKLAGNSLTKIEYEYFDRNVDNQINYYRLKQFDFDGTYHYTKIISIDNRGPKGKEILKITNLIGQKIDKNYKGVVIIQYSDGSSEKTIQ